MCSLVPRGNEYLYQIHDPGLSPGGHKEARLFAERYAHLQAPQIILTSHLRRCLQMALEIESYLAEARPDLGRIRIVAHPDLQEVSIRPCDTGTPLDVLHTEFPGIEFPDAVFPEIYPRSAEVKANKWDTIFDDTPALLAARAERIREYIKYELNETEIILISHGSFLHFLMNWWAGEPGNSRSLATQLQPGDAIPFTLPGSSIPGLEFKHFVDYEGPEFPSEWRLEDYDDDVALRAIRDCGIFTIERVRNA
jgi:broad specificity phosphatase PhoE